MITKSEARDNIGRGVVYRPHPDAEAEDGVITGASGNGAYVYVRYRGDEHSKATHVRDLDWLAPQRGGQQ